MSGLPSAVRLGREETRTLAIIADLTRTTGRAPTVRQIVPLLRTRRTTAYERLRGLRAKRLIVFEKHGRQPRASVVLTAAGRRLTEGESPVSRSNEPEEDESSMEAAVEHIWNPEVARRLVEASAVRIDDQRPREFQWSAFGTDSTAMQQEALRRHALAGDAMASEDTEALVQALGAKQAVFLVSFLDFTEIQAAESCPKCGRWPPGICDHQDVDATFVARDGPGGFQGDPSWKNRHLRDGLVRQGDAKRAELSATRETRFREKEAEIIRQMQMEISV